jgi:hypothetical protein
MLFQINLIYILDGNINMKKNIRNILKLRRIVFNDFGQLLFIKAYSVKGAPKFLQSLLKKGS